MDYSELKNNISEAYRFVNQKDYKNAAGNARQALEDVLKIQFIRNIPKYQGKNLQDISFKQKGALSDAIATLSTLGIIDSMEKDLLHYIRMAGNSGSHTKGKDFSIDLTKPDDQKNFVLKLDYFKLYIEKLLDIKCVEPAADHSAAIKDAGKAGSVTEPGAKVKAGNVAEPDAKVKTGSVAEPGAKDKAGSVAEPGAKDKAETGIHRRQGEREKLLALGVIKALSFYPANLPCPCGSGKLHKHCCGKEKQTILGVRGQYGTPAVLQVQRSFDASLQSDTGDAKILINGKKVPLIIKDAPFADHALYSSPDKDHDYNKYKKGKQYSVDIALRKDPDIVLEFGKTYGIYDWLSGMIKIGEITLSYEEFKKDIRFGRMQERMMYGPFSPTNDFEENIVFMD